MAFHLKRKPVETRQRALSLAVPVEPRSDGASSARDVYRGGERSCQPPESQCKLNDIYGTSSGPSALLLDNIPETGAGSRPTSGANKA